MQPLRQRDQLAIALGVALAVELGDRAEHLPHQLGCRCVVDEGTGEVASEITLVRSGGAGGD